MLFFKKKEKNMKLKPLYDRVLISCDIEQNTQKSKIILPENSTKSSQVGVVVAVGDGENIDNDKTNMKVKIGDKVLFNKYAGTEIKLDDKNYIVMRQLDIVGVFDERENC